MSSQDIINGITVKRDHYKELSSENKKYSVLYKKYKKLYNQIVDYKLGANYLDYLNNKKYDHPLWWERITLPENK